MTGYDTPPLFITCVYTTISRWIVGHRYPALILQPFDNLAMDQHCPRNIDNEA